MCLKMLTSIAFRNLFKIASSKLHGIFESYTTENDWNWVFTCFRYFSHFFSFPLKYFILNNWQSRRLRICNTVGRKSQSSSLIFILFSDCTQRLLFPVPVTIVSSTDLKKLLSDSSVVSVSKFLIKALNKQLNFIPTSKAKSTNQSTKAPTKIEQISFWNGFFRSTPWISQNKWKVDSANFEVLRYW